MLEVFATDHTDFTDANWGGTRVKTTHVSQCSALNGRKVGRVTPCAPAFDDGTNGARGATRPPTHPLVAQVSKPAVSPISKSAGRAMAGGVQVWKLAIQQTWKSALLGLLLGAVSAARAGTNAVTNLNDSGAGSLRQAIAEAAPGDTIDFAVTGTITLTSGELVIDKDLTISGPGATNLTVSGNYSSRVLLITNGVVNISDLTVANGRLPSAFGPASIAAYGAGVYNSATLIVSNCLITANTNLHTQVNSQGGGLMGGAMTIVNSAITKNYAVRGAGIVNYGFSKLINCAVSENLAGNFGAGIVDFPSGTFAVTNSTISRNRAGFEGGGISLPGTSPGATLWLFDSTVCSNVVGGLAGGIDVRYGTVHSGNSIVAGNKDAYGVPDCYTYTFGGGTLISHDYNLIGNTNGATITGATTHNIYGQDPLLGPLADNGGPTPTHALLPGSPAIDHGSSGGLSTDQRGLPRPFNFPAYYDADDASDIGAVEMQEGPQPGPVFTVNTTDDADDGVPGIAHCSLREAIAAANANADTNTVAFAAEVPGVHTGVTGTITLTNGQLTVTNSANIVGPGAANLTVSGNNASRVFTFNNVTASLAGLTISSGRMTSGDGAGINNSGGSLTINNSIVTLNTNANSNGGGIMNSGVLTLADTTISRNNGLNGAGIYNSAGTLVAINAIVASNYAANSSGAGVFNNNGILRITSSGFVNNYAVGTGGGINNNGGLLMLTNSTVSGNRATGGGGGGIASSGTSNNIILSSIICSNNSTGPGGGGVLNSGQSLSVLNSIIAGNNTGNATWPRDYMGALHSLDYNLIQNTNGATITNLTAHNLYNLDPKLGPLADLGGPTPTHALRFDSPALDAGHSGGLTTDQRGLPRPIDDPNTPNATDGDGSDIGAYEADPHLRITALELVGPDVWLRFNTLYGRSYAVESEDNLDNSWSTLSNNIPGTGGAFQAQDVGAANLPRRFYRGVLFLP